MNISTPRSSISIKVFLCLHEKLRCPGTAIKTVKVCIILNVRVAQIFYASCPRKSAGNFPFRLEETVHWRYFAGNGSKTNAPGKRIDLSLRIPWWNTYRSCHSAFTVWNNDGGPGPQPACLGHQEGKIFFWAGPKLFKLCPTHFSWRSEPPCAPLVTGLLGTQEPGVGAKKQTSTWGEKSTAQAKKTLKLKLTLRVSVAPSSAFSFHSAKDWKSNSRGIFFKLTVDRFQLLHV